jgi:hypothetical protein
LAGFILSKFLFSESEKSRVVEHSSHIAKVEGSSQVDKARAGKERERERERERKRLFLFI